MDLDDDMILIIADDDDEKTASLKNFQIKLEHKSDEEDLNDLAEQTEAYDNESLRNNYNVRSEPVNKSSRKTIEKCSLAHDKNNISQNNYTEDHEDDMMVIVIGDENEYSSNIEIKNEVNIEDNDSLVVDDIIKMAKQHGEMIENIWLKEEPPDVDNENSDFGTYVDDIEDEDYIPDEEELDESFDEETFEEYEKLDEASENRERKRYTRPLKPHQRKSFVKDLRQQYPELKNNKKKLVTALAEIMKNIKPPPPPQDYYILNGIMLECLHCGALSDTIPVARRHYQEKHGPRYLICYACGVDFRSTTNLYKHEKRCIAPDAEVVLRARAECLGRFTRRPYPPTLQYTTAPKPQKFSCKQCSAVFNTKISLLSHEYMHQGVRPFSCRQCPAAYTSRSALSRHTKKHGDKEYICDHCKRSFKVKNVLATHMDTHRPTKKFGCSECGKRYAQKSALVIHYNSKHLNLPPPCACELCPRRFNRMSLLKEHLRDVHGMELMTRKMFFKALPTLTESQINQAKVVYKRNKESPSESQEFTGDDVN